MSPRPSTAVPSDTTATVLPLIVNVILLWVTDKLLHVFDIENAKALWLMAIFVTVANGLAMFLTRF